MSRESRVEGRARRPLSAAGGQSQGGYALLLLLTVIGLGSLFMLAPLADRLASAPSPVTRVAPRTADALRQAKEALMGYAATYADRNPGNVFGYLPVPDLGSSRENNVSCSGEGCTAGVFGGNKTDMTVIGRLPWQSLNLPPLKDEYGECLWYAVSGSFQSAKQTATLNWDTLSYLDASSADGLTSLSGGNAHNRAVAIVFSAGPALPGQDRSHSSTDAVDQCGGNYDVRNYLDPHDATTATNNLLNWYPGSTNDATDPSATLPPTSVKGILASPLPANLTTLNDRAILITSDDIFRVVRRRSDFIELTLQAMEYCLNNAYVANGNSYPFPDSDTFHGNPNELTHRGLISAGCRYPTDYHSPPNLNVQPTATQYDQHFYYFRCDNGNSSCLRVWSGTTCKAAIVFGGTRTSSQFRRTTTERNGLQHPENYLESPALDAFNNGTGSGHVDLGGIPAFDPAYPSADVVRCLNHS